MLRATFEKADVMSSQGRPAALSGSLDSIDSFIWLFDERFDRLCGRFQEHLVRCVGRVRRPLRDYELFPGTADRASSMAQEFRQIGPERLNRLFLRDWDDCRPRADEDVPVVSFTMEGLEARPGLALFGPPSPVAKELNNKASQYRWLREAGLPVPPFVVTHGVEDLAERLDDLLSAHGALFVQPAHSAGGEWAVLVRDRGDLEAYWERATRAGVDESGFIATRFLEGARSLSGHGVVTRRGRVLPLAVDELLLNGFRFDGFVFPTLEDPAAEEEVLALTVRAGETLAARGYWGYFAADFLYRAHSFLAINEINVRFAGEAAFLAGCMRVNLFCLIEEEVAPGPDALIPPQDSRIVVTKIRPELGRSYLPAPPEGSISAFIDGEVDAFRVRFHDAPIRVVDGHFIGLAGRRFSLKEERQTLTAFYMDARGAVPA